MDEEREYELRKLEQHAIEYGKAKDEGFEGNYCDYIEERGWV